MLLWETLQTLSMRDLRDLDKCVRSPAFNQREHVVRLWDFLRSQLASQEPPALEKCFPAAFPETGRYDVAALRNSMTLLLRVVEEFLILRAHREDPILYSIRLANIWRQTGLRRQSARTLKWLDEAQAGSLWRNAEYHLHQWQIEEERYHFMAAEQRMERLNFPALSHNLDMFYLTEKLRQACFAISQTAITGQQQDMGLLPEILEILKKGKYNEEPLVRIYYHCYQALTLQQEEYDFQAFKTLFLEHTTLFPPEERRQLFLLATNYCIRRLNSGEKQYIGEALRFYKAGLTDGVILVNGLMTRFTYGNIVTMAIGENELDWAEQFMLTYRDKLEAQHQNATFSFHLARLEYERGRFDKALPLLQNAEYSDLLINLMAKTLALKIYYEQDEYDLLHAHLDAMRNFITRHKELGYHRENYRNTLRFLRKLLQLRPSDQKGREVLQQKIVQTKAVAEKNWLLGLTA